MKIPCIRRYRGGRLEVREGKPGLGGCRALAAGLAVLLAASGAGCGSAQKPSARESGPASAARKSAAGSSAGGMTNEPVSTNALRLAVFGTSLESGKDPFFPKSARRTPKPAVEERAQEPAAKPVASAQLKLTGLWPSKTKPLALINKTSFAVGERGEVAVSSANGSEAQKVKVCLLEIRPRSVLVTIEGEPGIKELQLPEMQ